MLVINEYAYGLDWRDGSAGKIKTISSYRKEGKRPRALAKVVSTGGTTFFGVTETSAPSKGLRSVAAMLATSRQFSRTTQNAFLFHVVRDIYAVVCTNNGAPVNGFDYAGDKERCYQLIDEFQTIASGAGEVTLYSHDMHGAQPFSIASFLSAESADDQAPDTQVKPLLDAKMLLTSTLLAVFLVGGGLGGYKMYGNYKEKRRREAEEERIKLEEASRLKPEVVYQNQLINTVQTATKSINMHAFWQHYSTDTERFATWTRVSVACDATNCVETYRPTIDGLVQWTDWANTKEKVTFDFGKNEVARQTGSYEVPVPMENPLAFFGSRQEMFGWVDALMSVKAGELKLGNKTAFETIPVVDGKPKLSYHTLELNGPLWIMNLPNSPAGLSVTNIQIDVKPFFKSSGGLDSKDPRAKVTMKGFYYVKD